MNLMSKPVVALATAVLIGASMFNPALAASNTRAKQMRSTTNVEQPMPADAYNAYNQSGNGSLSSDRFNLEPNFGQGNRCITDEGYGRWSYCDSGGSN
jgi:hypothetical protein